MDIITVDFETYYSKKFSLTKLTTEQYVRSPEFEVIGVAVKVNDGDTVWLSGAFDDLKSYLQNNYEWEKFMLSEQERRESLDATWVKSKWDGRPLISYSSKKNWLSNTPAKIKKK